MVISSDIQLEFEDELETDITIGMFNASVIDGVRLYLYKIIDGKKCYLEAIFTHEDKYRKVIKEGM